MEKTVIVFVVSRIKLNKLFMKNALLIFLFLLINTSFSQDISQLRVVGKAELMGGELIDKSIRDANGAICSGLIIVSDLTGLTFQSSNGIVKINSKPGNDFLFLSPDERVVTVYCTGYEPLKIILSEVSIRLKSGEVWQIKITGDKKIDAIPVNILVNQEAEIFIDGISKGKGKEHTINLSAGSHKIRLVKEGYKAIEETMEVSASKNLFKCDLKAIKPEVVEVRSQPKEAIILIDGVAEGKTDNQIFRFPGRYKLRLTLSGYLDIEKEIEVKENSDNKFIYNLVKNISTIILTTEPTDAEIDINNKSYGTQRNIELAPGKYFVNVKKNGYREKSETITIELGKPESRTITLEAITGNLQVKVSPIDAEVKLLKEGKEIEKWKGAKYLTNLIIGNYSLETVFSGYEKLNKNITISENKTTNEDLTLKKLNTTSPSITSETNFNGCGTPITYEGKTYNTVKIGNQCWMKENLDVGNMIMGEKSQFNNNFIEKYCYKDKQLNCDKYGGLYQWNEAMQYTITAGAQGICPLGWHIPTLTEFQTLSATVGNDGNALKAIGQGSGAGAGANISGFTVLLAGENDWVNGSFNFLTQDAFYWSSTVYTTGYTNTLNLNYQNSIINQTNANIYYGISIRCIKDSNPMSQACPGTPTITYEGKTYNTVQIGTQCWLKENLDIGTRINRSLNQTNNSIIEKYCYDDYQDNCDIYGGLFQWDEAMQYVNTSGAKGICPTGWHIPTIAEFEKLKTNLSDNGNSLKAIGQGSGTNTSGFSVLMGGYRIYNGSLYDLGDGAYFWSSTEINAAGAQNIYLSGFGGSINMVPNDKKSGFSVRCVKD